MTTNWIEELAGSGTFTAAFRLLLAMICGCVLGLNREHKRRPAGLRTYMLVCMSAALVMLTSQFAVGEQASDDVLRMGAQVISGIGFLGAGTILTGNGHVKGLTTAAGLWAAACLGLAVGIGYYAGAILGCVSTFLVFAAFTDWRNGSATVPARHPLLWSWKRTARFGRSCGRHAPTACGSPMWSPCTAARCGNDGVFCVHWERRCRYEEVAALLLGTPGVCRLDRSEACSGYEANTKFPRR